MQQLQDALHRANIFTRRERRSLRFHRDAAVAVALGATTPTARRDAAQADIARLSRALRGVR